MGLIEKNSQTANHVELLYVQQYDVVNRNNKKKKYQKIRNGKMLFIKN